MRCRVQQPPLLQSDANREFTLRIWVLVTDRLEDFFPLIESTLESQSASMLGARECGEDLVPRMCRSITKMDESLLAGLGILKVPQETQGTRFEWTQAGIHTR